MLELVQFNRFQKFSVSSSLGSGAEILVLSSGGNKDLLQVPNERMIFQNLILEKSLGV